MRKLPVIIVSLLIAACGTTTNNSLVKDGNK